MSIAFDGGRVFAVQTDRLYFFAVEDDSASRDIVVKGGLGYCPSSGAIFTVSESLLTLANVRNGKVLKRLFFADDHVSDITTSGISQNNTISLPDKSSDHGKVLQGTSNISNTMGTIAQDSLANNINPCLKINPKDQITAATFGKDNKYSFVYASIL